MNTENHNAIKQLQADLDSANHITYLTGAGVSTHSGIPDYRSKTGIYNGISQSPEQLLSDYTLNHEPEKFHNFVMNNMYFPDAKPNIIHQKIAQSCQKNATLITQNVDGLDKKAGNPNVIEFHGNLYNIFCQKCKEAISYEDYKNSYIHQKDNGIIRPGIVLYGEPIDQDIILKSIEAIGKSDLIIICGTSFTVYPFAQLLSYKKSESKVWVLNNTPIPAHNKVNSIIADALDIFKELNV